MHSYQRAVIFSLVFRRTEQLEAFTNYSTRTLSMTTFCQFDISPRTPPRPNSSHWSNSQSIKMRGEIKKKVFDYFASCLVDLRKSKGVTIECYFYHLLLYVSLALFLYICTSTYNRFINLLV